MKNEIQIMYENISKMYKKTGNIYSDIMNVLLVNNFSKTIVHSKNVAEKGMELAEIFQEDKNKVKLAAYLHDISVIIPNDKFIDFAKYFGIKIIKEEKIFPMIIHQKLSKEIAKNIFEINDIEILNAIECHTTLKAKPSKMDMILFIADKIKWDHEGVPPYLNIIEQNLEISLENGIKVFLDYLMDNKNELKVIHPLLTNAHIYFKKYEKKN